jgi:hypothetical protein
MTNCAAPRHDDSEPAEPHATLCKPCRLGLARDLRRLPGLHADLEHLLVTGQSRATGSGTGLPVNEPASDCRSQIRHDLTYWCHHITQVRGLDTPPAAGDWAANSVAVMCGWLAGQVTWLTYRDWAGDMAGAIRDSAGRAHALLDPWVTKRFPIPGADGMCAFCGAGRMEATIYADDGDKRRSFIACPACGERLEPERWARYGRMVIRRRQAVPG